MKLKFKIC